MTLESSISALKGVGGETVKKFASVGVKSIKDLLDYWPRRYEDYSKVVSIKDVRPGNITIKARITRLNSRRSKRGLHLTEATAEDETGVLHLVWFNQPYRKASIKPSETYYISGNFDANGQRLSMVNPTIQGTSNNTGLIVPVYPERKNLNSVLIRRTMKSALPLANLMSETLPSWLVDNANLIPRSVAILKLHSPKNSDDLESARHRLAFEELFELQLSNQLIRRDLAKEKAPPIPFDEASARDFTSRLPFSLTDDQRRTVWQIYKDMSLETPANRLIEGDVGSGKTAVAAMAAVMAMRAGFQVLYMAPTELLARQHAETFSEFFAHTDWANRIALLIGSMKKAQKTTLHKRISDGTCKLVIGTHALISEAVKTDNVGLVIIDEQHRFGVAQRQKLRSKAGLFPHVICMTATPIPRSLALTLYGELDLSIIRSKPPGRLLTETKVVLFGARHALYQEIDKIIDQGRQAFVVAPLISESKVLEVKTAETLYEELKTKQLKHRQIGLLHGSMKTAEKTAVMKRFIGHKLDVLVATTVIEVGVNVPNASVMVVEGAERFGLAQLHQLRGRIGRAEHQGYCYFVPSQDIGMTKRLRAIESTNDGFHLAELDLELRGPGSIYGIRQSGVLDLRIADFSDRQQTAKAKKLAVEFIERGENLLHYPSLSARVTHFRSLQKLN